MKITPETIFSLNPSVALFHKKNGDETILAFLFRDSRRLVEFKSNLILIDVLKQTNGINTISTIARVCGQHVSILIEHFSFLHSENILTHEEATQNSLATSIFDRQLNFFANFCNSSSQMMEMQEKLMKSKVVILGLGGIGSWVAHELVRSGVKTLVLIDPDNIELSNLPRTAIYSFQDIGKSKAVVLSEKLCLIMSNDVIIKPINKQIVDSQELIPLIYGADLVINCSDYPSVQVTNSIVSQACFKTQKPHITCGGYDGHLSYIGQTVIPDQTSCWYCYCEGNIHEDNTGGFEHIPLNDKQVAGGTLGSISSITASIQVLEAIKILTGFDTPTMLNRRSEFDFSTFQMSFIDIPKLKSCSQCGEYNGI